MKQVTTELVTDYIDAIMDDYVDWCGQANISSKQMKDTKYFAEEGRNYIKIVHDKSYGQKSVHSFIVKEATPSSLVLVTFLWRRHGMHCD